METTDYQQKINELLDSTDYKKLDKDPTMTRLRKINRLIRISSLPEDTKKRVTVSEAQPPRLYGLPKIHKENVPLRPISSSSDDIEYAFTDNIPMLSISRIMEDDVLRALKKKSKCTAGPDGIPSSLPKDCAILLARSLLVVFYPY
nr:unnamed protein product [Callosobruchus chinensis]